MAKATLGGGVKSALRCAARHAVRVADARECVCVCVRACVRVRAYECVRAQEFRQDARMRVSALKMTDSKMRLSLQFVLVSRWILSYFSIHSRVTPVRVADARAKLYVA